jgi:hypothetical protein
MSLALFLLELIALVSFLLLVLLLLRKVYYVQWIFVLEKFHHVDLFQVVLLLVLWHLLIFQLAGFLLAIDPQLEWILVWTSLALLHLQMIVLVKFQVLMLLLVEIFLALFHLEWRFQLLRK